MRLFVQATTKRTATGMPRRWLLTRHPDHAIIRVDLLRRCDRVVYGGVITIEDLFEFQKERARKP